MKTYVVYHLIFVSTPNRYIPKLFVTDVPDDKNVDWNLVDEYKEYGEFGMSHANHYIEQLVPESPPELKRAFRNGDAEQISYDNLVELKNSI
jgi:hypothetical protein